MLVLGVESSCDETAVSLVEDGRVLSSAVRTQVERHAPQQGPSSVRASRRAPRTAARRARGRQREKELFSRDASSARGSRDASEVRRAHIHPRRRARDREFASGVTTPHAAPVRRCFGVDVDWFTYYVMVS